MSRIRLALLLAVASLLVAAPASQAPAQNRKRRPATKKPAKPPKPKLPKADRSAPAKIAPVNPDTLDRVLVGAERIDQIVAEHHRQRGVQPNPLTTDEQFVRRIYLDITGTIPTFQQARVFVQSRDPKKRQRLIDRLLNSPGYASHSYNYWANILRLTDRPQPNIFARPFNDWVKKSIRDNKPYDQLVGEMLTAEGKIWESPATGYYLRDAGMPLARVDNTVRVFLGTRIGCAQCHDHPFDDWTQKQFYEVAAFMYGTRTRLNRQDGIFKNGNPVNRVRDEMKKVDPKSKGNGPFVRLLRANMYAVVNQPNRKLKMPHDYAYDDAKPNQLVQPKVLFGEESLHETGSLRNDFSEWMIDKQNPRFTTTVANRLWKQALGVGLIEPADDIRADTKASIPELMEYLNKILKYIDYDLKEYQRIIYNSKTYQRQASESAPAPDEPYDFAGPALRRMSAEQVWDSLLTLAVYHPDGITMPSTNGIDKVAEMDLVTVTADEAKKKAEEFEKRWGRGATTQARKDYGYKGITLMRASELPAPLPAGHFLRQFGQGDRELISGASSDGSVPQILTMFNGPVTHMMLEEGSVIYDNVVKAQSLTDRIDVIFLSILGRKPTRSDKQLAIAEIKANGNAGYGNVIWALINTREFLFVQ